MAMSVKGIQLELVVKVDGIEVDRTEIDGSAFALNSVSKLWELASNLRAIISKWEVCRFLTQGK